MRHRARQHRSPGHDGQAAERPLVDEAQLAAAVRERQAHPQVGLVRLVRRHDQQLAAHAQVPGERVAGVQRQPQVLAAALGGKQRPALEQRAEVVGAGLVPAHRPGVRDLDPLDHPARDAALEAAAHDLDLGQLGH